MMADTTEAQTTTTTTSVTINVGYPTSWQGILKIMKFVFLFCCLICSAILVSAYGRIGLIHTDFSYCLAVAVIGFITELLIFILYVAGVNRNWAEKNVCSILMLIYHVIMLILLFAATIVMTGTASGAAGRAYNAFAIFAITAFGLEIYFNIIWLRGGPELVAFSVPGQ